MSDQRNASPLRLLAMIPFLFFASACGSKLAGTFVGFATVSGGGYDLDEKISDVTVILNNQSATAYYLTFGENSPIQCKLLLDNMNSEDNDPENDEDLLISRVRENEVCELRGKNGQVQTAKIESIGGGRHRDGSLNLVVTLETEPTYFNFSYQGDLQ